MSRGKIKKIAVQKHDEPSFVIEQLLDHEGEELVFSIPKGAKFSESISNYRLLKRQAELLGAIISVESVDEEALSLANESGVEAKNPFFRRIQRTHVSDIIVRKKGHNLKSKKKREEKVLSEDESLLEADKEEEDFKPVVLHKHKDSRDDESLFMHKLEDRMDEDKEVRKYYKENEEEGEENRRRVKRYAKRDKLSFSKRKFLIIGILVLLLILVPYFAFGVLPRAYIDLETAKEEWDFSGKILADTSVAAIYFDKDVLPGQMFSEKLTQTFKFPAHGEEEIERKATGKITIYNAYNSQAQDLVATTRFRTDDGKVFRIVKSVKVPGAKIEAGKIVPASVEAEIIADRAGESYNIDYAAKLSIPGFVGTDKADAFYGEIKDGTKGGFIGKSKVATEDDLKLALGESRKKIEDSVAISVGAQIPDEFLVLDDAKEFVITKEIVNDRADSEGNFSVTLEAEFRQFAFKESDLKALLSEKALTDFSDGHRINDSEIEYLSVKPDFSKGELGLTLSYSAFVERDINEDQLKKSLSGEKEREIVETLKEVEGLSGKAKVKLWPFWVKRVPGNLERIELELN